MKAPLFYCHTDHEGDSYALSEIQSKRSESCRRSLTFSVSINDGEPESSMEWLENSHRVMRHGGHLVTNGLFGSMVRPIIHDALDEWLKRRAA